MFTQRQGWVETTIDHPIRQLSQTIVFPKDRPCQAAELVYRGQAVPLHVMTTGQGGTQLTIHLSQPEQNTAYRIRWIW